MFLTESCFMRIVCKKLNANILKCLDSSHRVKINEKKKNTSHKWLFFQSITPQLQRLYTFMHSIKHMKWHQCRVSNSQSLSHPSNGETWKKFNHNYLIFFAEPKMFGLDIMLMVSLPIVSWHYHIPQDLLYMHYRIPMHKST